MTQWSPAFIVPAMTEMVAGTGGMCRLTPFGGSRAKIMKALHIMFAEGLIAFICGHDPYHLRFLPPVGVMKPAQFGPVFEVLERSFEKVDLAD